MVGYSRLMDLDEEGTLRVLNLLLDRVIKPSIAEHQGRIVKQTGDGLLAEFGSVLQAVQCAIDIQRNLSENEDATLAGHSVQFRIGINTGDIIIQDSDVYGAGVNVASRLESIADPGGICLSRPVFDQVKNRVQAGFVDLGEYQAKNIADPIHAYKIDLDAQAGSFIEYDSQAMRASSGLAAKQPQNAGRRALVFAIGGTIITVAIALGLFFILAKMPEPPLAVQVPELQSTQPEVITQIIEPPPDEDLLPGVSFRDCNFCPEMVVVPAGTFVMGNNDHTDASPPLEVTITNPFAISKFEITFDQWDACARGGGCGTYIPDDSGWGRGKKPAINISWNDARAYTIWLSARTDKSYRLPTEAEWEYSAQAGSTQRFPWGNEINPDIANYGFVRQKTLPVGSFEANAFGLYDMIGNVAEWVSDCYEADAYRKHNHYPAPVGNSDDSCQRVLRGGSWTSVARPDLMQTSRRQAASPSGRYKFNGLRVLRVIEPN